MKYLQVSLIYYILSVGVLVSADNQEIKHEKKAVKKIVKKEKTSNHSTIKLSDNKSYIKMILRSYDKDALRCGLQHVLTTLKSTGSVVQAVIRMPVRRKLFTVLRGPHVDKTSREQFDLTTHKCTIYVTPNSQTMDVLRVLCLPSAVGVTLR